MVDSALLQLVQSERYLQSLDWHIQQGRNILPLQPEVDIPLGAKALAVSECTTGELSQSLEEEPLVFQWFVDSKVAAFASDDEEEYPPGEEVPEDERPETIAELGFATTFLIGPLCEFTILRHRPESIEAYAKRYRIPQAKKYAKTVARLFKEAREKAAQEGSK